MAMRRCTRTYIALGVTALLGLGMVYGTHRVASGRYFLSGKRIYLGGLHRTIADADRIVVRAGGFDCCGPVDNDPVLFQSSDPAVLKEVYDNLAFKRLRDVNSCLCCGYPGIDWYRNGKRIALTAVQHGAALRWGGADGDMPLTAKSQVWLKTWMSNHIPSQQDTRPEAAAGSDEGKW